MKRITAVFISLIVIAAVGCSSSKTAEQETAAIASSGNWLAVIDNGQYADSWDDAADYMKNIMTKDKWEAVIKSVREPLGKVESRVVRGKTYTTQVPGAPDGEYVVIEYNTDFENKKGAIETVTPKLEADGTWKVSGYFVK